jgi:hypothetical protein
MSNYLTNNLSLQVELILEKYIHSENYNNELEDESSPVYSFFCLLGTGTTEEEFSSTISIIDYLFYEKIFLEDILTFFKEKKLEFSFQNLNTFLSSLEQDYSAPEKKQVFFDFLKNYSITGTDEDEEGNIKNYGNFFSFIFKKYSKIFNGTEENIFFLISDNQKFLSKSLFFMNDNS